MQVGLLQRYAIQGGVKPYSVFSNDPAVVVGWIGGDDFVSIGTVVAGKATVTVLDSKGTKFDIAVTSGSSTAFFTTAPAALSLSPGAAQARTYTLGGGTGPYTATSNFPSVATVTVDGNRMTITGQHIDTNSVTITMRDAAGATLTSTVLIATTKLQATTGTYKVWIGDTVKFFIWGGTPPYRIQDTLNNAVTVNIVNGNEVEMTGIRAVDPVTVEVIDADGQTTKGPVVTFTLGSDPLRIAPAAVTIPENSNTQNIVLNVFGVVAGSPITVFTTDNALLVPGTPVKTKTDGTSYTIALTGGNTCSLVFAPAVAAIAGVDNTVPKNNTFTDKAATPAVASQPVDDIPPVAAVPATGGNRTITITVLDSTGRQGTSVITVTDTDGKAGCS